MAAMTTLDDALAHVLAQAQLLGVVGRGERLLGMAIAP